MRLNILSLLLKVCLNIWINLIVDFSYQKYLVVVAVQPRILKSPAEASI